MQNLYYPVEVLSCPVFSGEKGQTAIILCTAKCKEEDSDSSRIIDLNFRFGVGVGCITIRTFFTVCAGGWGRYRQWWCYRDERAAESTVRPFYAAIAILMVSGWFKEAKST